MGSGCYACSMPFSFDAGRVSLDLLATLSNRCEERLADPAALGAWLTAAGVADAGCPATVEALAAVRELRTVLFAVVDAELHGERPRTADVEAINGAAAVPVRPPRLVLEAGCLRLERIGPSAPEILGSIARDAIDLLGGSQRELLRECAAEDCSGIYLDASPARTRRWCSAARCGNRARVAAHRARRGAARADRWDR